MMDFRYCVAIRTLGKAGEKFQRELESLKNQTIPPTKILVYIAEGYPIPKETIGIEQYIYVKKGMVAQRALPYDEVDTDYVLLLDDDVYLPEDGVEKLYRGLMDFQGDAIAVDTFHNHKDSFLNKFKAFLTNWAYPRKDDDYAFKVQRNASFSYNNYPSCEVYLSESAAGPASFWKVCALKGIHFEDELWMDALGFAYGEDLLFYNKLVKNGGRLLVHYNTNIEHLDAQSERKLYEKNPTRFQLRAQMWLILWYRTCFNLPTNSGIDKALSVFSFFMKFLWNDIVMFGYSIAKISYKPFYYQIKGTWKGWRYVHSAVYRNVPNFILKKR